MKTVPASGTRLKIERRPEVWSHGHDEIIAALAAGDGQEAAAQARRHLLEGQNVVMNVILSSAELRSEITVVMVTHNMQQAARSSDHTAFFLMGELVEVAPTDKLFTAPSDERTEAYVTGRFG